MQHNGFSSLQSKDEKSLRCPSSISFFGQVIIESLSIVSHAPIVARTLQCHARSHLNRCDPSCRVHFLTHDVKLIRSVLSRRNFVPLSKIFRKMADRITSRRWLEAIFLTTDYSTRRSSRSRAASTSVTFLQELSKSDNIYYCVICIISTCYLFRSDDLSKSSLDVNEKKLKMKYLRIKESFAIAYSLSSFQYLPSLTKAMSTSLTDIDMTGGMMYIHAYSLSRNFAAT